MKNIPQARLESSFEENSEDNRFIHWILSNGKNLLIAFFGLVALFFIVYRVLFGSIVKSEHDFITAENDYQRLLTEKNQVAIKETVQKLEINLKTHPELHAKYDALIARRLIATGNTKEAAPFALNAILRTESENAPLYSDYSKTSLLIAESKLEQALQNSLKLKETLNAKETDELLFALNLLRIGMLQQQLKLEKDELATWNEWGNKIANKNNEAFQKLVDYSIIGQISLTNYIETRKENLRKS